MTRKIFPFISAAFLLFVVFAACSKELSFETGKPTTPAVGSLKDSLGNCLPDSVVGTFYNGVTPGGDTAYVELQVNVITAGTYNISTDTVNGFSFADSGFFTTTGINIIRLKPVGKAILPVITNFSVFFDTSVCFFSIDVKDSTGTGLGGEDTTGTGGGDTSTISDNEWKFTEGTFTYAGNIDSASKDNSSGLATGLHLFGSTVTGDTIFSIQLVIPNTDVTLGTFTVNQGVFFSVVNGFVILYTADGLTSGTNNFSVTITAYDAVNQIVEGTFTGPAQAGSGGPIITITNGFFKAKLT